MLEEIKIRLILWKGIGNILLFMLLFISCSSTNNKIISITYYDNGQIEFEKIIIDNKTTKKRWYNSNGQINFEEIKIDSITQYKLYYDNGILNVEYTCIHDSIKDGWYRIYYENGLLFDEVFFRNGLEEGVSKTYHPNGLLKRYIEYIIVNDSPRSRANTIISLNEQGDTLYDESLFIKVYCIKDTIKVHEKYHFTIKLAGAKFDRTTIHIGNYDTLFTEIPYDTDIYKFDANHELTLKKGDNHLGWNYIRGKIINYEMLPNNNSRLIEMFHIDSFYVW